jgi:hypothetical protein
LLFIFNCCIKVGSICIKLVCGGLCFNRNKKSGDVNIRPYYDRSHWNYFRKSSLKEVFK